MGKRRKQQTKGTTDIKNNFSIISQIKNNNYNYSKRNLDDCLKKII